MLLTDWLKLEASHLWEWFMTQDSLCLPVILRYHKVHNDQLNVVTRWQGVGRGTELPTSLETHVPGFNSLEAPPLLAKPI